MEELGEESLFDKNEVSNIIKGALDECIGNSIYNHSKVNTWLSNVIDSIIESLIKLQKAYKYIVTGTIVQKNGAGLHTASSCLWDSNTDGSCTLRWDNNTMYCIISVFGLAV